MAPNQSQLDWKQILCTAHGKRMLLRIAEQSGIFLSSAGASDNLPFREGQRSLGMDILREAALGLLPRKVTIPQLIALLASEANPQETNDDSRSDPESDRE